MTEDMIGVFIPIIFIIVTGLVMVTFFYFRSKEKQMLIEKGLSSDEIKTFYEKKKDPFVLMKIGIISIFFGIGLGIGLMMQENTNQEFWIPFLLFVSTGIGFVLANISGRSLAKKEKIE